MHPPTSRGRSGPETYPGCPSGGDVLEVCVLASVPSQPRVFETLPKQGHWCFAGGAQDLCGCKSDWVPAPQGK